MDLLPAVIAAAGGVLASLATLFTARKMGKLGVGTAQLQLSTIREETIEALQAQVDTLLGKISGLEADFKICRDTLHRVEVENRDLTEAVKELTLKLRNHARTDRQPRHAASAD